MCQSGIKGQQVTYTPEKHCHYLLYIMEIETRVCVYVTNKYI